MRSAMAPLRPSAEFSRQQSASAYVKEESVNRFHRATRGLCGRCFGLAAC